MSVSQATAFFDRFRGLKGLGDFLSLLKGVDITLVDDIFAAAKAALVTVGTEARLDAWMAVARLFAKATKETDVDDQVVAGIDTILAGPLRDLLVSVIDRVAKRQEAEGLAFSAMGNVLTVEEQQEFRAAGIDAWLVIEIVKLLMPLLMGAGKTLLGPKAEAVAEDADTAVEDQDQLGQRSE
jgi:hypothetical protein